MCLESKQNPPKSPFKKGDFNGWISASLLPVRSFTDNHISIIIYRFDNSIEIPKRFIGGKSQDFEPQRF